jgi:hypothetical protein
MVSDFSVYIKGLMEGDYESDLQDKRFREFSG